MINKSKYIFSHEHRGELELELDHPTKQIFAQPSKEVSWSYKGLILQEPAHCQSLYFFEWQRIQFKYVVKTTPDFTLPIEFRVNDRVVKSAGEQNGHVFLAGSLTFADSVGKTHLEIRDGSNKLLFQLNTEVFPQKMDYKSDYRAMMAEITQIISNLTYDVLKDTYHKAKPKPSGQVTDNEWWNILDALFENLLLNLGVIKRMAKHEIQTSNVVLPVDQIRHASKHQVEWFRKNRKYSNKKNVGLRVRNEWFTHAPSKRKFVTYDTWENRFVAWAIKGLVKQLSQFYKNILLQLPFEQSGPYKPLLGRVKKHQSRLQSILHDSPFNEVGEFEKRSHFSTSLTRGSGYRDFFYLYILLTRGLELSGESLFKIEQKNISTLYEYWCYLKLVQIVKEQNQLSLEYQDLIKVQANRTRVALSKGQNSKIIFKDNATGKTTTLFYNKEFKRDQKKIYTFNQQPDISICFYKNGYEKPFWYLLDAKYRFEDKKYEEDTSFNVPQDAIGQLHRYRDAILHSASSDTTYRKAIKNLGGVLLYPYPLKEEGFKENQFYRSLRDINIGALPFLPGKTKLLCEFLQNLMNKSPEEHYEQFVEMDASDYESKRNRWSDWVTIGVIPRKDQAKRLEFLKKTHLYHIPFVQAIHSKIYMTRHLLLCLSGSKKAYMCEVENWEVLTDKDLMDLDVSWNLRQTKYIGFRVSKLTPLETPSAIAPISFRYASKQGLDLYLANKSNDKNYFYLSNADAARLYEEIKKRNLHCEISWVDTKSDPSLIEFNVDGKKIRSSDTYPNLQFLLNNQLVELKDIF